METTKLVRQRNVLSRVVPIVALALGAFKVADWLYSGRTNSLLVASGVGFLLMGTSILVQSRLARAGRSPGLARAVRLVGVFGLALAAWALVQRWL